MKELNFKNPELLFIKTTISFERSQFFLFAHRIMVVPVVRIHVSLLLKNHITDVTLIAKIFSALHVHVPHNTSFVKIFSTTTIANVEVLLHTET